MKLIFSVDVEEWFDGLYASRISPRYESRLRSQLEALLDMLDAHQTRATFFWLGIRAKAHPDLVALSASRGHEIGCHGLHHTPIYDLSPKQFRRDLTEATNTICQQIGKPVTSFRAPFFSITSRSYWALDILCELGYKYDSSIFPINHWRYGIPGFKAQMQILTTGSGKIVELPLPVRTFGRNTIPLTGGAYFRIYPYRFTKHNLLRSLKQKGPIIFYIHPWELDAEHPRITGHSLRSILPHYYRLESTQRKLEKLLQDFSFGSIQQVLESPEIECSAMVEDAIAYPELLILPPQAA